MREVPKKTIHKPSSRLGGLNLIKKTATIESVAWEGDIITLATKAYELGKKMTEKNEILVKNFLYGNESCITDKNLIPLVWQTAKKLTNCTLNPLQELEIFYQFMTKTFDYLNIDASLFSDKSEYDVLKQGLICTSFLLDSNFAESDSSLNSTRQHLWFLKTNVNHNVEDWNERWKDKLSFTFTKIKQHTAKELKYLVDNALEKEFEEKNVDFYCLAANVFSTAHLFIIEKSAQAFQLFYNTKDDLEKVVAEADALYEKKSLTEFYDMNSSAYHQAIISNFPEKPSDSFEKLCKQRIDSRKTRPKYRPEKGLCYPDVKFIREQNPELFNLPVLSDEFYIE